MLLAHAAGGRELVAAACEQCRTAGVRPGMTVAHARALLPHGQVEVRPARFEDDERALEVLARWALRFAPVVAADPPDGLLLDVSGCDRLYGDDEAILRTIVRHVEALGIRARATCADTIGCAWAVARYDTREHERWRVVPPGEERAALAHLPVAALRLDDETVEALADVSVEWIGALHELPRTELAARYGPGARRGRGGAGRAGGEGGRGGGRAPRSGGGSRREGPGGARDPGGSGRAGGAGERATTTASGAVGGPGRPGRTASTGRRRAAEPRGVGGLAGGGGAGRGVGGHAGGGRGGRGRGGAERHRRPGERPTSPDVLLRLDQALGEAHESVVPVRDEPPPSVDRAFPGPTTHPEGIRLAVRELVDRLAGELERRGEGALHLQLDAERPAGHAASEDEQADAGGTDEIRLRLVRPACDPDHLERLLRPHVERLPLDTGIDRLVLSAPRTGPMRARTAGLPGTRPAEAEDPDPADDPDAVAADVAWGELVDALVARLGEDRVLGLVARPTRVPESRYRPVRLDECRAQPRRLDDRDPAAPGDFVPDRPSRLFQPPEPIEVVAGLPPGVPPRRFRHRGRTFDVVRALGPERLGAPWWRLPGAPRAVAALPVRDYFRVLDDHGRWLWIYRRIERAPRTRATPGGATGGGGAVASTGAARAAPAPPAASSRPAASDRASSPARTPAPPGTHADASPRHPGGSGPRDDARDGGPADAHRAAASSASSVRSRWFLHGEWA